MPKVLSQLVNTPKPLLSKPDLQKFNLCQIYLQVLTLSDIATSSVKEIDCTSGKDTGHPASPLSPGPTKSDHPQPVGQSGARHSTFYSQTQSGPPKSCHNNVSIAGTQTPPPISFGPPSLILPPPYSTLDLHSTTPSKFTPIEIASATTPLPHTLHSLQIVYQLQSHIGSHLW